LSASIKFALLMFVLPFTAFGAGGTCPSGANYLNTSTNSLVTLSSLGVTSCYFIAANGSDSNDGTTETTSGHLPWAHAPGMPNCTSNCASATISAGTGIIFRGGDTWHFGNSSLSPYTGGTLTAGWSGSSGHPIYFGVDQSWYYGSVWARPIFTGDNPTSTSVVSSCLHQSGSSNQIIDFSSYNYGWFDNFEVTGFCQAGSITTEQVQMRYGESTNMVFTNNYSHGWTHVAYSCSGDAGICTYLWIFGGGPGGSQSTDNGETLAYNVVDGSDSDPAGAELGKGGFSKVFYNVFRYVAQTVANNVHSVHDNWFDHWYCPGDANDHPNTFEELGENTVSNTAAVYNNVFSHILSDSGSCAAGGGNVLLWPDPPVGNTEYAFNNVSFSVYNSEDFNIGQNGSSQGSEAIFNNSWENSSNSTTYACQSTSATVTIANDFSVTDNSSQYGCSAWNPTKVTNLLLSHATATTDGYVNSGTYAWSPPGGSGVTVGAGTNEKSAYCSALTTIAASDAILSDAASACLNDTRYACTYSTGNHTVNCPARTVNTRPTSAAWDVGSYEYSSASPVAPTVTTTTATSITSTSASSGGVVSSNGGASVTSEGVCYAITANPTTPCTSDGTATPFTSSLSGLTASTLYYYRAFATNSVGTSYGSDLSFTTAAAVPAVPVAPAVQLLALKVTSPKPIRPWKVAHTLNHIPTVVIPSMTSAGNIWWTAVDGTNISLMGSASGLTAVFYVE